MLSKSQIKLIKSLSQKKFRNKHKLFVVEGLKGVREFLNSDFELVSLYVVDGEFEEHQQFLNIIDQKELKKISFLKTPQKALAVFKIPVKRDLKIGDLTVVLDGVRDPGNLGTIIRLCDWFGIENLICSLDTVDCYNPKVVQASMGSLTRVEIFYSDLVNVLGAHKNIPVFGTMLNGENIYSKKKPDKALIVMGNEANGISEEIQALISNKITIPQFGEIQETESLNVATATSIILSEFRRSSIIEK
ncbi:TrmH family RNA methyltransferase [Christiangramia forsetii]|uniref:TrmH family tRNA/rRNA methyltransferase n=2 Tax=Christiangramia forsetii TaxID=411153 RepID=A0LYC6_CHRFK|nr:RNA methyltransferase [Christiangramia forsetii]GGG34547.1 RNA methyltransferase [Christiangramia forsetii]CAL65371.1 TrmH family tRNA/rRNA methyltransferase [Christiangramia forsetii KT0803]